MVQSGLVERAGERVGEPVVQAQRPPGAVLGNQSEHQLQGIALARLPAHEGIGVVRHEKAPVGVLGVALENDRRREAAQQGWHRSLWHVGKREALLGLAQLQDARGAGSGVLALEPQRQRRAGGVQQAERKGNVQGLLLRLARRRRSGLRDRESVGASARVVVAAHPEPGRAGLGVPATELRQIPAGGRLHGGDEVLAGDRLAVVALEVDLHAALERRLADQRMQHADHLGALLVHRGRVEVVDLEIAVGADRMGERPASSRNCVARRRRTSAMRLTGRECRSEVNSWSRNTVSPPSATAGTSRGRSRGCRSSCGSTRGRSRSPRRESRYRWRSPAWPARIWC